ncbi:MAG: hypothetical protein GY779_04310 [Gammaproteobacteria bacterium]|nr:hypothetical protein [Gammaproteobacteria bacterium]
MSEKGKNDVIAFLGYEWTQSGTTAVEYLDPRNKSYYQAYHRLIDNMAEMPLCDMSIASTYYYNEYYEIYYYLQFRKSYFIYVPLPDIIHINKE